MFKCNAEMESCVNSSTQGTKVRNGEAEEKVMDELDRWPVVPQDESWYLPEISLDHLFFLSMTGVIDGLHWNVSY